MDSMWIGETPVMSYIGTNQYTICKIEKEEPSACTVLYSIRSGGERWLGGRVEPLVCSGSA